MASFAVASLVTGAIFASGLLGLLLQRLLPRPHTSDRSRDMISSVVGITTLLLALVLGLLIWTAYGVYTAQKTGLQSLVSGALQFDQALMEYGPEANAGRALLKNQAAGIVDSFGKGMSTLAHLGIPRRSQMCQSPSPTCGSEIVSSTLFNQPPRFKSDC
jgi:hypothetical protein